MKKFILLLLLTCSPLSHWAQKSESTENQNLNISRYLEIFNYLYKELDLYYVDTLDAQKNITNALSYMLQQIDPYTEFYDQDDTDDLRMMATGKYAGIGSIISYHEPSDRCIISEPYEGQPAAKAGLQRGDIILRIDGEDMDVCGNGDRQKYSSKISNALRGEPNTTLEITIARPGKNDTLTFHIERETISLPSVDYSGIVSDSIGYISVNSYTENTSREFRQAWMELKEKGAHRLIIDLRGNGGGIMVEAVKMVNLFLPRGLEVLSTRGKVKEMNSIMKTTNEPLDTELPIVVLTDFGTASAAEITSGALQDYDRAVIMGRRTYGKGLVQTVRNLPYHTKVKVTTSKYYIPSGRCVQAYEYKDGLPQHLPDSLAKTFYTKAGRPVLDGGGITPDILLQQDTLPNLITYLAISDQLTDYAVHFRQQHETIAPAHQFVLSDEEYKELLLFLKNKNFTYDQRSRELLSLLRNIATFEGYAEETKNEFESLESKLTHNLDYDFKKWETEIRRVVESAIVTDYYFQRGRQEYELRHDKDIKAAIELLNNDKKYREILQAPQ